MATPTPLQAPVRLAEVEQKIVERIREFDVMALLELLASIGHGPDDIAFRAHRASGPQPTLLHEIAFLPRLPGTDSTRVLITVNLGLLSCRSPLPSYFQRLLGDIETSDPVHELIDVLDRSLLHTRLTWDHRERSLAMWDMTRRNFLRIFGLDSPLGLDWLFRRVFPELEVEVRRISDEYRVPYDGATLGESRLGACTFGNIARVGVHDMEVLLICEGALYRGDMPWVREGDRRLRSFVFPLLDEVCMTLTVVFVLMDRGEGAHLGPTGHIGYNPMWRPGEPGLTLPPWRPREPGLTLPPCRVELYRGALPREEPDSDALELALADAPTTALQVDAARARFSEDSSIGAYIELPVHHTRGGLVHRYRGTIHWGARVWHHDEPHAIRLTCEDVPKTSPSPHEHPRLWAWLRDQARAWIADRLAREVMSPSDSARVTTQLIDRLIVDNADQHLHALYWSNLTPMQRWDDEAWRRFASWRSP